MSKKSTTAKKRASADTKRAPKPDNPEGNSDDLENTHEYGACVRVKIEFSSEHLGFNKTVEVPLPFLFLDDNCIRAGETLEQTLRLVVLDAFIQKVRKVGRDLYDEQQAALENPEIPMDSGDDLWTDEEPVPEEQPQVLDASIETEE